MTNYYYILSASLALERDEVPGRLELEETRALLERQALPIIEDFWARQELINMLDAWASPSASSLEEPSLLSAEQRAQLQHNEELWPAFARAWRDEHALELEEFSQRQLSQSLWSAFYRFYAHHPDPLLRDYYRWEQELQFWQQLYSEQHYHFVPELPKKQASATEMRQALKRGAQGLSEQQKRDQPFLAPFIEALESGLPLAIFQARKNLLWQWAEEQSVGHYYDRRALQCYALKFALSYRHRLWLDRQGSGATAELIQAIYSKISQP